MRSNVFEAFISGQSPGKTSELSGVPPAKPPIRSGKTSDPLRQNLRSAPAKPPKSVFLNN
jgi:hypothetical protein